jgi:hypothetical protein
LCLCILFWQGDGLEEAADVEVEKIVAEALAGVLTSASSAPRGVVKRDTEDTKVESNLVYSICTIIVLLFTFMLTSYRKESQLRNLMRCEVDYQPLNKYIYPKRRGLVFSKCIHLLKVHRLCGSTVLNSLLKASNGTLYSW